MASRLELSHRASGEEFLLPLPWSARGSTMKRPTAKLHHASRPKSRTRGKPFSPERSLADPPPSASTFPTVLHTVSSKTIAPSGSPPSSSRSNSLIADSATTGARTCPIGNWRTFCPRWPTGPRILSRQRRARRRPTTSRRGVILGAIRRTADPRRPHEAAPAWCRQKIRASGAFLHQARGPAAVRRHAVADPASLYPFRP
jgi:hypothetical protein